MHVMSHAAMVTEISVANMKNLAAYKNLHDEILNILIMYETN